MISLSDTQLQTVMNGCRRPREWSRDSCACEHEKLSDGAVAAVICCLTFS